MLKSTRTAVSASRESWLPRSRLHGEILCRSALSAASNARRSTEAHAAAVRSAISGIRDQSNDRGAFPATCHRDRVLSQSTRHPNCAERCVPKRTRAYVLPLWACARTPFGVSPKRERKSRLKCEISEKPACNAMSQIRTSLKSCAVRSLNACFSRSSVTCAVKQRPRCLQQPLHIAR